jgi:TorA maturation chaperone TorD
MIEARTIDMLRFLGVALAFPTQDHLKVCGALARALQLPEALWSVQREEVEPDFHRLFSGQQRCSPYETEYGPGRSVRKAVELADIAGFYQAFHLAVDGQDPEMVDHISLELDFLAQVGFKERYARLQGWSEQAEICEQAYVQFWRDHLGRWSRGFFESLQASTRPDSYYQSLAGLGLELIASEAQRLEFELGRLQPDRSEIPAYECLGCVTDAEVGGDCYAV